MNGKNLNVQYRRNSYAKKRIKVIAAIIGISLALLLILFLVIGGLLNDKVEDDKKEDSTRPVSDSEEKLPHAQLPSVKGYGISLSGITTSAISDKVSEISKADGSGINFVVRDADGKEIYDSSLAQSMGKQSSSNSYIEIGSIASRAANRGLRASAIVPVTAFSVKDDLERSVLLAYDAALCAEISRDGADDVLIRLQGSKVTEDSVDELVRLADTVKGIEDEALIGISLTREMLEEEGSEILVAKLWESFDFLAFDITDIDTEDDPKEFAEENVNSEMHYYLLRYNMRVLLPDVVGDDLEDMVSVLTDKGLSNWQTVISN